MKETRIARNNNNNHNSIPSKESYKEITVSICGSYSKHLAEIGQKIKECKGLGIKVRIPKYAVRVRSTNGFIILRGEKGTPKELQDKNFDAISRSSFVLVVNPNGYIGPSTALEIGYACSEQIPVFCTEEPREFVFTLYTIWGKSVREIKEMVAPIKKAGPKAALKAVIA